MVRTQAWFGIFTGLVLAACSRGTPTQVTDSPTARASSTQTPTITSASPATETATQIPDSPTSPQVEERDITPTEALSPDGPWLVFYGWTQAGGALWAMNADGSGLRPLTPFTVKGFDRSANDEIAYVASSSEEANNFDLYLLDIPSGDSQHITTLIGPEELIWDPVSNHEEAFEVYRAIEGSRPAWSPDGRLLAFAGALDGPTSDLYVYDRNTGVITRLTSGPTEVSDMSWSPDSRTILHVGYNRFGTGAGDNLNSLWAVSTNGEALKLVEFDYLDGGFGVVEWISNEEAIVYDWNAGCGNDTLRTLNVTTGQTRLIWEDCFLQAAYESDSGSLLFNVDSGFLNAPDAGVFLDREGQALMKISENTGWRQLIWSPEADLFFYPDAAGIAAATTSGEVVDLPSPAGTASSIIVSPDRQYWAWKTVSGLWVGPARQQATQVFYDLPQGVIWLPDSSGLIFTTLSTVYVLPEIDGQPHIAAEGVYTFGWEWDAAWSMP